MTPAIPTDTARRSRPRLRLLDGERPAPVSREQRLHSVPAGPCVATPPAAHVPATGACEKALESVLVAGADHGARARMLSQLRQLLPDGTPFVEASETWEVVARAPESRMVVLTGDLHDLSARGLVRVLSRRHPMLAVIVLENRPESAKALALGAASL